MRRRVGAKPRLSVADWRDFAWLVVCPTPTLGRVEWPVSGAWRAGQRFERRQEMYVEAARQPISTGQAHPDLPRSARLGR